MIKVIPNFISEEEEKELLSHLKPTRISRGSNRNRIVRYGSRLPYQYPTQLIPAWLHDICIRVTQEWQDLWCKKDYRYDGRVNHVTVNEYHKSQSIDWHIDSKTSGAIITVLSLESDALMGMKDEKSNEKISLPVRSLLHMTEEDRWDKQHCIYPVDNHRWSLVFRKGIKDA